MKKLIIVALTILALFISSSCGRRETEFPSDNAEGTVHIDSTIDETTINGTTADDTTVPELTESSDIPETTAEMTTSEPVTSSNLSLSVMVTE